MQPHVETTPRDEAQQLRSEREYLKAEVHRLKIALAHLRQRGLPHDPMMCQGCRLVHNLGPRV
jgi:hypothetical protein